MPISDLLAAAPGSAIALQRAVLDALPDLVGYVDADLRYRYVNLAYRNWFGVRRRDILGRTVADVVGDAAFEHHRPHIPGVLQGQAAHYAATIPYTTGTRQVEVRLIPDVREDGSVPGMVVLVRDLSERLEAEVAVRESEARLRALADNLPHSMIYQMEAKPDGSRRFLYVSKSVGPLHGVSPEEALEDPNRLYALIAAEDLPGFAAAEAESIRTLTPFTHEVRMRRPDGSQGWSRLTSAPRKLADGAIIWDGLEHDVTDRRRSEVEAAAARRRLEVVFDNATVALFIMDERQQCVYMNRAAERLTGYTLAETQGRALHDVIHHTRPDGRPFPLEECAIDRAFPQNMREQGEEVFVHKDGSFYPVAFSASPIRDPEDQIVGTIIEVRGTSEEKAREARQRLLLDELNHRVKNTLASVQSLALQTGRTTTEPSEFVRAFQGRLMSLSRAHDLLTKREWTGASLQDVVAETLRPYVAEGRIAISGPAIDVAPDAAVALNMAFHELATNAVKYGALSKAEGRVAVTWTVDQDEARRGLQIDWVESGGPPVSPPERQGFGARLIRRIAAHQLNGESELTFAPEGLRCRFLLPVPQRSRAEPPRSAPTSWSAS